MSIWELLVVLLLAGLWLLLLRVLKLPLNVRSTTLRSITPDQARQLFYLNAAFITLLAGALWIVAWATAQFTETGGIIFLTIGVVSLIQGLRLKAGEEPSSPKSGQTPLSSDSSKE